MEEDIKFSLEAIDKTFVNYNTKQVLNAKVVLLNEDGAVCNIGGKSDAFIEKSEYPDFENAKVGDVFKVITLGKKNDEGMVLVSKEKAEGITLGNSIAESVKIGEKFSFVVDRIVDNNLTSKLGEYKIVIPYEQIALRPTTYLGKYLHKQFQAVALEINKEKKQIIGSIAVIEKEKADIIENTFWPSLFINKTVEGRVKKIMPYGAFVDVEGVDCFVHISNLSYDKIDNPDVIIKEGETYTFKIITLDKENKKIYLGYKQMFEDPKLARLKELVVGQTYKGIVTKILGFGAIVALENKAEGLLHISDAGNSAGKRIYELVKLGDELEVDVKEIDFEKMRVSLLMKPKKVTE